MITKLDFEKMDRFIYGAMNDAGGANGQETRTIQSLIDETKTVLSEKSSNIGEWEDLELRQAHILLDAGFLHLAVISVGKAIAISCLSPEEYAFGFAVVNRQARAVSEIGLANASAKVILQDTAQNLKTSEKLVAMHLEEAQEQTAKRLLERQVAAADELEQKNLDEGYELSLTQEKALEALHEGEKKSYRTCTTWSRHCPGWQVIMHSRSCPLALFLMKSTTIYKARKKRRSAY